MRGMGHPEVVHLVMHKPKLIELYLVCSRSSIYHDLSYVICSMCERKSSSSLPLRSFRSVPFLFENTGAICANAWRRSSRGGRPCGRLGCGGKTEGSSRLRGSSPSMHRSRSEIPGKCVGEPSDGKGGFSEPTGPFYGGGSTFKLTKI